MNINQLSDWLVSSSDFKEEFNTMLEASIIGQFGCFDIDDSTPYELNWDYLLRCASFFCLCHDIKSQDIALRICTFCIQLDGLPPHFKDAASIILGNMSNRVSIDLAVKKGLLEDNLTDRLSFNLLKQWVRTSIDNTIVTSEGDTFFVNDFQKSFWESASQNKSLTVSAPTSAGKSFILNQYLVDLINKSQGIVNIVYLVPTRALIQQVERDLIDLFNIGNLHDRINLSSLPLFEYFSKDKSNIFVFTQERFRIMLNSFSEPMPLDLLVVDEAQKIGDSYRGVLLEQVISDVSLGNKKLQILYASPMTENPEEVFKCSGQTETGHVLSREDVMVNQNLLWATQIKGKPKEWLVEVCLDEETKEIGIATLTNKPGTEIKKLIFFASLLGGDSGGNLIYIPTPSGAEKSAKLLSTMVNEENISPDEKDQLAKLKKLVKEVVHEDYGLVHVLSKGVAFHYGNMPLLVRSEVERLFRENIIKFLVCTSTLVEGVNLPCKNIFIRSPKKGLKRPMDATDFWNLAGRAGRWGQEFQGNIFCIDARNEKLWKQDFHRGRKKYQIVYTTASILDNPESLYKFIEDSAPRDKLIENMELEYVFSYLFLLYETHSSLNNTLLANQYSVEIINKLDFLLADVSKNTSIPLEIIKRNPGISPIAIESLYSNLKEEISSGVEIISLIPLDPSEDEAFNSYVFVFLKIQKHLYNGFGGSEAAARYFSLLTIKWLKGEQLKRIIKGAVAYKKKNGINYNIDTLIREVMSNIEEFIRFLLPKYLMCYIDVLKLVLKETGSTDVFPHLDDLHVMLEFGVSDRTQLSLMGLGLSRFTAIEVSSYIEEDNLNEEEVLLWIEENVANLSSLPYASLREVNYLLKKPDSTL